MKPSTRNRKIIAAAIIAFMVITATAILLFASGEIQRSDKPSYQDLKTGKKDKAPLKTYSYRFVVLGDSRGEPNGVNEEVLRDLMSQIKELKPQPKFILFGGDMVNGGDDMAEQLAFWKDIMDDYYPVEMVYPAIGNHEDSESTFSDAFPHLPNDQVEGYGRTVYYFDYGNARFFVLNSNRGHKITSEQRAWLKKNVKDNRKTHNFAIWHEPAFPTSSHVGSSLDRNERERNELWDILDDHGGTMVFVSHEHTYTRRHINPETTETPDGAKFTFDRKIYQITTGAAGAPLVSKFKSKSGVDVPPRDVYHYVVVDVKNDRVSLKAFDDENRLIDSFSFE